MARLNYRFEFREAEVKRLLQGPEGEVDKAVRRAAGVVRDRSRQNLRQNVGTGRLIQSIRYEKEQASQRGITYLVGSDLDYAIYLEEGTRDHGPRTAKPLRFKPRGSSTFVFAKRVRGIAAIHYLKRALQSLGPSDFTSS
jgi:hypothetical protein